MADLVTIAAEQPLIRDVCRNNPEGFANSIAGIVTETIQISGRKDIADADKYYLICVTQKEIQEEYKFLTGAEIRYAFAQGVRGRYGEYYQISLPTFIKWLEKYLQSDERQRILAQRQTVVPASMRLAENATVSDNDVAEVYRGLIDRHYRKSLQEGAGNGIGLKSLAGFVGKILFEQLVKDKKVLRGERTMEDVFTRYKENGQKAIYQQG